MSKEELANHIERFILRTARENGPNSGKLCMQGSLEAIELAFRNIADFSGDAYWSTAAAQVEFLRYTL
jgi:hypothetical protein